MICPNCKRETQPAFFCYACDVYMADPSLGTKAGVARRWIALFVDGVAVWIIFFGVLFMSAGVGQAAGGPDKGMGVFLTTFFVALIGYTVSAAVLITVALTRSGGWPRGLDRRAILRFAAVGIGNSSGALLMYMALAHGPVTLVSPLVATYPLVTLLLGFALLRNEPIGLRLAASVAVTVGGVILLILA